MTSPSAGLAEKLELFVFTYNRAEALRHLLGCFVHSRFAPCSLTILDNHSTDETPRVCEQFKESFPRLKHVRHPRNIGGLANYLRAIELAQAEYAWILCDDDHYRLEGAEDVAEEIAQSRTDLISIGVEGHTLPGGYRGRARAFAETYPFFLGHSLVPALIFRAELFSSECLRQGYDNIHTMFPHFPFLAELVRRDASLYVSKDKIIFPGVNYGYSAFRFLRGWVQSASGIPERDIRGLALRNVFAGGHLYRTLLYSFLTERSFRPGLFRREFLELLRQALICSPLDFLKMLPFLPLLFLPRFAHDRAWRAYATYRRKQGKPLPNFDEVR